jgi:hypothetical protein
MYFHSCSQAHDHFTASLFLTFMDRREALGLVYGFIVTECSSLSSGINGTVQLAARGMITFVTEREADSFFVFKEAFILSVSSPRVDLIAN